jgi:hypothetical protein
MSENRTSPKKSGQALHNQYVTSVAKLFADSGWNVLFDTVGITPGGSPVRADLRTYNPQGQEFVFEFKMGNSQDYLPMSAYAQGVQLNRSGIPAIVVTNMKVPDPLAELFRESRIPVIRIPAHFDQNSFLDSLRAAVGKSPEILVGRRRRF